MQIDHSQPTLLVGSISYELSIPHISKISRVYISIVLQENTAVKEIAKKEVIRLSNIRF